MRLLFTSTNYSQLLDNANYIGFGVNYQILDNTNVYDSLLNQLHFNVGCKICFQDNGQLVHPLYHNFILSALQQYRCFTVSEFYTVFFNINVY